MNMGPKGSHVQFGESYMGQSVVDGPESIIGMQKQNHKDDRVSKNIPEVIVEEQEIPIKREPPQKQKKKQNIVLSVNENKKKKKKEGPCC